MKYYAWTICENEIDHEPVECNTDLERYVYAAGFVNGAYAYGAGSVMVIWPRSDDWENASQEDRDYIEEFLKGVDGQ